LNGKHRFKFIDLFAGIGGFRIPFDELGGKCVFTSEKDSDAIRTYEKNFASEVVMYRDITKLDLDGVEVVPDHDLLIGGFPCQPFSSAGLRGGFEDTRGTLFFYIKLILDARRPKVVILENVRGLRTHDKGRTFRVIIDALEGGGYTTHSKVLNARDFGLPQNRQRLFIVGIRSDIQGAHAFSFPEVTHDRNKLRLGDILDALPDENLTISDRLWSGHQERKHRNRLNGKGFGYQIFNDESKYAATLSARYSKDGSEILISQPQQNPRKLSVTEARKLQGFPDWFLPSESSAQAYKQFGNAVPVPVIRAIALQVLPFLE
jgi:DNA (cytosine-5)-methyltransferase 1